MADVTPNYSMEIFGVELEKDQLTLNIKSAQYRIMQAQDEIDRINVNITATRSAIAALDTKLKSLRG